MSIEGDLHGNGIAHLDQTRMLTHRWKPIGDGLQAARPTYVSISELLGRLVV